MLGLKEKPSISVVIPAYNAENLISGCLQALLNQTVDDSRYEILVVDDGSADNTSAVVRNFENVRLIRQENKGPAAARNEGAKKARGDLIFFTDADCIPRKDWIEEMVRPFEDDCEIAGVRGSYMTKQRELAARFVQIEYEDKYDLLKKDHYIDFVDTYSAGFRRDIFLKFGGYDTSFPVACAEDVELSFRMSVQGYKMVFNSNATVYHRHPRFFFDYFKKKYKFAYWRMLAVKKNPEKLIRDSHTPQVMKLQTVFFPLLVLTIFIGYFSTKLIYLSILVVIAFFISTIPFVMKAMKKDFAIALLSPFILVGRSISQFFGVFNGTIKHLIFKS
jgi:cellulose synthase/poly-beta-1,6-N-acetylglucosamine synthase-like glycosyltransferase